MRDFIRVQQTRFPQLLEAKFAAQRGLRLLRRKPFEPEFEILRHLPIRPDQVAIDVGANRGQSIDAIRMVRPGVPIVAFEANPYLAGKLQQRFGWRATIHSYGLHAERVTATLYIPTYRGWRFDGLASMERESAVGWLTPERMPGFRPELLTIEEVPCRAIPLDEMDLNPAFIKIDVQGLESEVLQGARQTVTDRQPALLVEHEDEPPAWLAGLGYQEYAMRDGQLHPVLSKRDRRSNSLHLTDRHRAALP